MREGVVVADSGPLIGLARIEQLHLLPALASRILLPQAVWNEVTAAKTKAPGALEISRATWIEVQQVNPTLVESLRILLDPGEAKENGIHIRKELIDAVLREVGE
ncbi:MAG: hypothetical protein U0768_06750 [Anaerolineae bacterium]